MTAPPRDQHEEESAIFRLAFGFALTSLTVVFTKAGSLGLGAMGGFLTTIPSRFMAAVGIVPF